MAKSSNSSQGKPLASKLLEVDSDLATQEAQLAAQLTAIQEKRKSLQTVITMFSSQGEPSVETIEPVETVSSANGFVAEAAEVAAQLVESTATPAAAPTSKRRGPKKGSARRPKSTYDGKAKRKKEAASPKSNGRSSKSSKESVDWQPYVRAEYRDRSLPQAVLTVLEQHPNDVVEVPHIISSIFVDDIPKQARLSARDRLSNVLSVGLKNQKWYRGKTGNYSVSKEAAEASRV